MKNSTTDKLEEAIKILSDMTTTETTTKDPLFGIERTIKAFTNKITPEHNAAFSLVVAMMTREELKAHYARHSYQKYIDLGMDDLTATRLGQRDDYQVMKDYLSEK